MKPVLDACCGSRMFWFDRRHPDVVFMTAGRKHTRFATGALWKSSRMSSETSGPCLSVTGRFALSCSTLRT